MARSEVADVAIIGGGPAGLAAAAEAKGAGAARVIMIERDERVGGILNRRCTTVSAQRFSKRPLPVLNTLPFTKIA